MSGKERKINGRKPEFRGSLSVLLLYATILGYYVFTGVAHKVTLDRSSASKVATLQNMKRFRHLFFTGWNFALQIIFLLLAVGDETAKLTNWSNLQKRTGKLRFHFFTALVFPSSLLVASFFWTVWHLDRELIFPKALDDVYPNWLNHTLHTVIIVPLLVEVLSNSHNLTLSSTNKALTVLTVYCTVYQALYVGVYYLHGVWLYPIYGVLNWPQRIGLVLVQFVSALLYQRIGIFLLKSTSSNKIKSK